MLDFRDQQIIDAIHHLIFLCGGTIGTFESELISQMIQTSLKLLFEGHDTGQLKLINRALKEMRYAYGIFNEYKGLRRCVSIFGSARTAEDHPDYLAAKTFSYLISKNEWMCITGAANGIMKAGLEGPNSEDRFGLAIRLPFEDSTTNLMMEGDPKLIIFRYFFTRKLMFLSHSDSIAVFPGGFGTLDELFEVLTLIQTGKTNIIPIVLMEAKGGIYWKSWEHYVDRHLLLNGWISEEDKRLYYIAPTIEDGIKHIQKFYFRYHSSRYVKDKLVIRLSKEISQEQLQYLNKIYAVLVQSGSIEQRGAFEEETDCLELPRLVFHFTRKNYGTLRMLIDQVNDFPGKLSSTN